MSSTDDGYENAACALLTLAPNGRIERPNRTACTWTGLTQGELENRSFQDLLTIGSKLFCQTHWWPLLALQGSVAEVQLELAHHERGTIPILVNALKRSDGRIDVAFIVAADRRKYEHELLLACRRAEDLLETLRQREAELRTITDNAPDGIARFERDRRCGYVNRALHSLTGRSSDEWLGRHVDELDLDPDAIAMIRAGVEDAFAGNATSKSFVYRPTGKAPVELEGRFIPERNRAGDVATVLTIARDVSALNERERAAQRSAVLAEQFVGIVSHDLRNPLNAILVGAQLLAMGKVPSPERIVEKILSSTNRATRLISDLLDLTQARLGSGLPVQPVEIDLHAVVAETLDELRLTSPGRAVDHRRIGEGRGLADADRVAQLVTNLVGNAVAYGTPTEAVTVTSEIGSATLALRVHNHGKPIPRELASAIFEPLRRGDEHLQTGSRSVGLGLFIVREIAKAHRGSVTVTSEPETGTTFFVEMPRA